MTFRWSPTITRRPDHLRARCETPGCGGDNYDSLSAGARHVEQTGHVVVAFTATTYRITGTPIDEPAGVPTWPDD